MNRLDLIRQTRAQKDIANRNAAGKAYTKKQKEIRDRISEISRTLIEHSAGSRSWASVGDLEYVEQKLSEITDQFRSQ